MNCWVRRGSARTRCRSYISPSCIPSDITYAQANTMSRPTTGTDIAISRICTGGNEGQHLIPRSGQKALHVHNPVQLCRKDLELIHSKISYFRRKIKCFELVLVPLQFGKQCLHS